MPRINDPQFYQKITALLNLRGEQHGFETADDISLVVNVRDLLSGGVIGAPSVGQRVALSIAGEANALTTAVFGYSRHFRVTLPLVIRQLQLDISGVLLQTANPGGTVALNGYVFVVRQATPTYAAGIRSPTNLRGFSAAPTTPPTLPFDAGASDGGTVLVSLQDPLENFANMTTEVNVAAATQLPAPGGLLLRSPVLAPDLALAVGDFLGLHADFATTATFPAGNVFDSVFKLSLVIDY